MAHLNETELHMLDLANQLDAIQPAARAMLAALKRAAICLTSHESLPRPPDFYETAFNTLVENARAAIAQAEAAGITAE